MLPRVNRLQRRQDFSKVYRKGIRRNAAHLILRAYKPPPILPDENGSSVPEPSPPPVPSQPTRIGISISQKVSKLAVVRNRLKRQIRAAFRQILPRLSSGWDLVIVVQPQATECNYCEFLQELEQLLADAEVLNGH